MQKHPAAVLALVLVALLLGIYWHTLFGHPVHTRFALLDDVPALKENPHLVEAWDVAGLKALISRPYFFDWTPLYWVAIWVQRGLFGNAAVVYRAVSLLAFWSALLILFDLLRRWTRCVPLSAGLILILGAHPLTVETLAWPTTQKTVLSLLLAVLVLALYDRLLRCTGRRMRAAVWIGVATLCLVAFGVKLRGLTLPFCLAAYDIVRPGTPPSARRGAHLGGVLRRSGPLMLAALLWAAYNQIVIFGGSESAQTFDRYLGGDFSRSVATHAVIELRSLFHWVRPGQLYFFHNYTVYDLMDWQPWASVIGVLGVLGALVWATPSRHRATAWFCAAWYVLQRALTVGLFPYQWGEMCNRYALVASMGLLPLASLPWLRLRDTAFLQKWQRCIQLACTALVVMLAMQSWIMSTKFMTHSGLKRLSHPDSTRVRYHRLLRSSGGAADAEWLRLRTDKAAPTAIGWIQLAHGAAHWGQDRYERGLDPPDREVHRHADRIPLSVYRLLILADYYAGTGRPARFRDLLSQAFASAPPRFTQWMAGVESDLQAGCDQDWYVIYLRIGDGVARRGELEEWRSVLTHALELPAGDPLRRRAVILGCGIQPDAPFWRRQWTALDKDARGVTPPPF